MTIPDAYFHAEFWDSQGWMAPWLHEIDSAYWREMIPCICENLIRRKAGWQDFILTPEGQQKLRLQLCTRLSQASQVFVPWLEQARPLAGLRILEIGCGSGSATAALARAGACVTGVDIQTRALNVARKRLPLLGIEAAFMEVAPDWLESDVDAAIFPGPYDLIVCYAMLEHLLIPERLHLLALARTLMQRDGAMLATFETPNRFSPYDWHSSKLVFTDSLPDELAFAFARARSERETHPAKRHEAFTPEAQRNLYRGGRGVSWHEFDLAFGMENITLVLDGYSPRSVDQKNYQPDKAYEDALAALFAKMSPPVPRGFCRPSLELLIALTP
ncbi:MAG TPA: class I SAM-dependent methyltransferase [Rhizomicrobium sp.]|nr:class I SAM-dependent methyltransferase [Rhizomicrobium sp.]